jgi:GPI ethanolamine phosphate transferase 2/3 subunit F
MPLIDPVTMSSAALALRPAAKAKENELLSQPTPTNATALAQTATHLIPVLQLAVFIARFDALVADPVSTMMSSLPIVAALQIAYVLICLPPAGSQGNVKPAKKTTGRGASKKGATTQAAIPNIYVVGAF